MTGTQAFPSRLPLRACLAFMDLVLARSVFEVMLWMGLMLATLTFGLFFLRRIRGRPAKQESSASQLLSKFSELHSGG